MSSLSTQKAIEIMRRNTAINKPFKIKHLTYNRNDNTVEGVRVVENCVLRRAMKENYTDIDSDHYLPYIDRDLDEERQCFKVLIRGIAYAPHFQWYNVQYFNND